MWSKHLVVLFAIRKAKYTPPAAHVSKEFM